MFTRINQTDSSDCVIMALTALDEEEVAFTIRALGIEPGFFLTTPEGALAVKKSGFGVRTIVDPAFFNQPAHYVAETTKQIARDGAAYIMVNPNCPEHVRQAIIENKGECGIIAELSSPDQIPAPAKDFGYSKIPWAQAVMSCDLALLTRFDPKLTLRILHFPAGSKPDEQRLTWAVAAGVRVVVIHDQLEGLRQGKNPEPRKFFLDVRRELERLLQAVIGPDRIDRTAAVRAFV